MTFAPAHPLPPRRRATVAALVLAALAVFGSAPARGQPVRLTMPAFDSRAVVEVRGLEEGVAETAARAALAEIAEVEALAVNPSTAGDGDPRWSEVLSRALDFCRWSEGANGPLGGALYDLWDAGVSDPARRRAAVPTTRCDRLTVDAETGSVTLSPGSRLDLRHFAAGWAADRAVAVLRELGIDDGFVRVGPVHRGFGPGPDGRGWPVRLPVFPGHDTPLGDLYLRDNSLAVAATADEPFIDQRNGQQQDGVVAVLAVSELGLDAQGLATSLYLLDTRTGMYRAGQLEPKPSALWLLGSGEGRPLLIDFNWSAVELPAKAIGDPTVQKTASRAPI